MHFINPEELNTYLAKCDHPFLLIFLDKRNSFYNQKQILEDLFNLFADNLRILLLDTQYLSSVKEKFQVHGFPAFIFLEKGRKKDVLLGVPFPETLKDFITNNLSN